MLYLECESVPIPVPLTLVSSQRELLHCCSAPAPAMAMPGRQPCTRLAIIFTSLLILSVVTSSAQRNRGNSRHRLPSSLSTSSVSREAIDSPSHAFEGSGFGTDSGSEERFDDTEDDEEDEDDPDDEDEDEEEPSSPLKPSAPLPPRLVSATASTTTTTTTLAPTLPTTVSTTTTTTTTISPSTTTQATTSSASTPTSTSTTTTTTIAPSTRKTSTHKPIIDFEGSGDAEGDDDRDDGTTDNEDDEDEDDDEDDDYPDEPDPWPHSPSPAHPSPPLVHPSPPVTVAPVETSSVKNITSIPSISTSKRPHDSGNNDEDEDYDPDEDTDLPDEDVPKVVEGKFPPPPGAKGPKDVPPEGEDNINETTEDRSVEVLTSKPDARGASFFAQPGILAAVIGGAVLGLLFAILLVMFILYRIRKKDEGVYTLEDPKRVTYTRNDY